MDHFEIVQKLIGPVKPYGSSHIDSERNENLSAMIELHEKLTHELIVVSRDRIRQEASMKNMGQRAHQYLKTIKDNFNEEL